MFMHSLVFALSARCLPAHGGGGQRDGSKEGVSVAATVALARQRSGGGDSSGSATAMAMAVAAAAEAAVSVVTALLRRQRC